MDTIQKGLNANQLKLIAITAMTIDHLTWTFFPGLQTAWYVYALHIIGRLTAPIMWFFIAEGAFYTRDIKKYILRLLAFAALSHFTYCFAFGIPYFGLDGGVFNRTGVMWSLALAVIAIAISRHKSIPEWSKIPLVVLCSILGFISDWSSIAVMAPFYLYQYRGNMKKQGLTIVLWTAIYAAVYFLFLSEPYAILQLFTALSIPFLARYNGTRGDARYTNWMKWLFYWYYPAHLIVIGALRLFLHGDIPTIF